MTILHHPDTPASPAFLRSAPSTPGDLGWLRRVGIMNDYLRVPYANGSTFASQLLCRELEGRGHRVSIVGPSDPIASPDELPESRVELASIPLRNHPGVRLAVPSRRGLEALVRADLQLLVAQTCQAMLYGGVWLRRTRGVPFVCVNTVHMPAVYNVMLPDRLHENRVVHRFFGERLIPWVESHNVAVYNECDCLVVLSPGLERYWRKLGVTSPIHVIPRAIEPSIFEGGEGEDPFPAEAKRGGRLLVACRHTREKEVERLLEIFARQLAPRDARLTLTLVGDGPDHDAFVRHAERLGIADRVFFTGERTLAEMPRWYRNADLFVYTSLSETYGQVVSEALYCRLPVVAFDDAMGVAGQITDGVDGYLVSPDGSGADGVFAARVLELLADRSKREGFAEAARRLALRRCDRTRIIDRYYEAFEEARVHRLAAGALDQEPAGALLAQWGLLHGIAGGMGLLRPPAVVNRRNSPTPSWTVPAKVAAAAEAVAP